MVGGGGGVKKINLTLLSVVISLICCEGPLELFFDKIARTLYIINPPAVT